MGGRLPGIMLRVEGLAVLAAALVLYREGDVSWWAFIVLFLAPDLGMAGYLAGPVVGAVAYNVTHFEALPVVLAVVGVVAPSDWCVALGLIWLAHIGLDRALGYGLKYPSGFKDTHLQRV